MAELNEQMLRAIIMDIMDEVCVRIINRNRRREVA